MESEPAKRVRARRSREEIGELIASYRQSGQRQREFCQQRSIGLSTLQNYLRRERTTGQQKQRRLLETWVAPTETFEGGAVNEKAGSCEKLAKR